MKKLEKKRDEFIDLGKQNLVNKENFHTTLVFLGNVSLSQQKEIQKNLKEKEYPGINAKIKGLGVFPEKDYIRVVYAEIISQNLGELREKVLDVVENQVDTEGNSYTPHITLSRVKNISGNEKKKLQKIIRENRKTRFGRMKPEKLKLKESVLKKDGPVHRTIETYELNNK